jgi:hypothetical protein
MLHQADPHDARRPQLLGRGPELPPLHVQPRGRGALLHGAPQVEAGDGAALVEAVEHAADLRQLRLGDVLLRHARSVERDLGKGRSQRSN